MAAGTDDNILKKKRGRPRKYPPPDPTIPKRSRGRPRKDGAPIGSPYRKISRQPTLEQIADLRHDLAVAGYEPPEDANKFQHWLRALAEPDFFFFMRWIYYQEPDRREKVGAVHRELCTFITDYSVTRRKLLMMPMGHLKTSFCSQGLPLHILIQRPENNHYFPGKWGCDQRILLANESEDKCQENLSVVKQHLEGNVWIAWLWPHACWENPRQDSAKWQEFKIIVPRQVVISEASVTAVGALTAILGRHYDVIILDDIAGARAGQSWEVMSKVKKFKKAARSRLSSPAMSIEVGIGTHQSADDVYLDWQKDDSVETMIRAIEEGGAPLWPENPDYSPEGIEKLRRETDPILWALWYMNKPVSSGFTAMDWGALREFRWDTQPGWMSQTIEFEETMVDRELEVRSTKLTASPLLRFAQGLPLERQPARALTMRRMFGQKKPDESFMEHMRGKHGCPNCAHGRHVGNCIDADCSCYINEEPRPWEMVLKGPL